MVVKISFSIRDCANVIHKADLKGDVWPLSRLWTRLPRHDPRTGLISYELGVVNYKVDTHEHEYTNIAMKIPLPSPLPATT